MVVTQTTGTFKMTSDPMKSMFYEESETGQCYINLSKGFLHKNIKPYSSNTIETQAK